MPYRRFEPDRPYRLRDVATGQIVCTLTGAQLDDLLDHLVRERDDDRDYWFDDSVVAWLAGNQADPELVETLRVYVARRGPAELAWAPEDQ